MSRTQIKGSGVPLRRNNIDTDQIIPARFCLYAKRTGHGDSLFADWRMDPDFVLNDERFQHATILVAGREFATGSSREYAVWAIKDYGFSVIIAETFGDIFYKNAIINDLLPLKSTADGINWLWENIEMNPTMTIDIDLDVDRIRVAGREIPAMMAPHLKSKYIRNIDDITRTILTSMEDIQQYEIKRHAHAIRIKQAGNN